MRSMRGAAAVGFALWTATGCATAAKAQEDVAAFTNVHVLTMTSEGVLPRRDVVVSDGLVVAVAPAGQAAIPAGATRIDGTGKFLLPGLAEMHAHVPPGDDPPRDRIEDILFLYVANGITTIRGMLGSAYQVPLAGELERGEVLGPTFYVGAPSINGSSAPTPADAERLVRTHAEAGYHLQKIHPGVSRPTWDRMVRVAREAGLTFGGHVPADVGLLHAIESGMSTVDHLDGYVQAIASDEVQAQINAGPVSLGGLARGADGDKLAEVVRTTVANDVFVVPTMYLWSNLYGAPDPDATLRQPEMRYVSPETREGWRRRAQRGGLGPPDEVALYLGLRLRILGALSGAGAKVLMGTDSPQLFNVPGFALHRELRAMADAGMSNQRILESGTVAVSDYVSRHLGMEGNFGTVEPGQRADLVLVAENPLDDLAHLRNPEGVMVRGRWVPKAEIEARLDALAAKHAER